MLKLRPYKKNERGIITSWITLEHNFYELSAGQLGDYPVKENIFDEYMDRLEEDTESYQMVAVIENNPVGYLVLHAGNDDHDTITIQSVIIDPGKWGHGYGLALVGLGIKYSFDLLKAKRITVWVYSDTDIIIKGYRSMGFMETGNTREFVSSGKNFVQLEFEIYVQTYLTTPEEVAVPEDRLIKDLIDNNKFNYAFQPIIDASTGEIFGYEALMRVDFGVGVSPMTILDYAKRNNRLYEIEKLTTQNVLVLYAQDPDAFFNKKIFINSIPGSQLVDDDYNTLKEEFKDLFKDVIVEITENTEFKDQELADLLSRRHEDGFGLAIDDYGTGYSNTSSLLSYLPDYLKIDRLLISNIQAETKKQHFVKSIIEFAMANGVKTLAEGVETAAELKTSIELGVDYIQGFYTAKPSFEIIENIDNHIKSEIIACSVKETNQEVRKIYTVNGEAELPIMRLALEKYTGILIGQSEFTLVGNTTYSADMSVKIKDNTKCRLTIRDVSMDSIQHLPCIELGSGCNVTLVLEGDNTMNKFGIQVPESSSLTIEGDGNLLIRSQGVQSYAIGNFPDSAVGDITWNSTGLLNIIIEADDGIGLGGGSFKKGCGINLNSGIVRIEPACSKAIAIGASTGEAPISIQDCRMQLDIKIEKGIGLGSLKGIQNTTIRNSNVDIQCSGSYIAAIGSIDETKGNVNIESSEVSVIANGQQLYLIGAKTGHLDIDIKDSAVNLRGEGSNVLAMGTKDLNAKITAKGAICNIRLASGTPLVHGAKPENISFKGGLQSISVNE